jgi:hypothetical protein
VLLRPLQVQMHQQAAFCLEELILHQPANVAHHLLLADTLYTLGGAQNWRTARSYYSGGRSSMLEFAGRHAVHAVRGAELAHGALTLVLQLMTCAAGAGRTVGSAAEIGGAGLW